jgi:2-oxo-4-hydroxy-4-carboxy-5-ureidoimidazoline decarboxylase
VPGDEVSSVLESWNRLSVEEAVSTILPCCGSRAWAIGMAARRPLLDEAALAAAADETWHNLNLSDWMEAFQSHPRIGDAYARQAVPPQSAAWSTQEQERVKDIGDTLRSAFEEGNREYERRFGRIFIVCASGKSAAEIQQILRRRLQNDAEIELREAAEQQRQITQIRLRKWLLG